MLIDRGHTRWAIAFFTIAAAALIGHAWLNYLSPEPLTGGSTVGLWYGVIGSALMIYAGLLSAHRKVPAWTVLGARKTWLKGHIWLGLLSIVFILGHSNYRWSTGVAFLLWLVLIGVLGTGIFGLILQHLLPQALATRVPAEAPYEQLPHLCRVLSRRADELVAATESLFQFQEQNLRTGSLAEVNMEVMQFHEKIVRPYLAHPGARFSPLKQPLRAEAVFAQLRRRCGVMAGPDPDAVAEANIATVRAAVNRPELKDLSAKGNKALDQVRDVLSSDDVDGVATTMSSAFTELAACAQKADAGVPVANLRRVCQDQFLRRLEALCTERRYYRLQERIYAWLHGWLLVHVPLSIALLILGVAHAIMALYR